jgi:hypothetical protein
MKTGGWKWLIASRRLQQIGLKRERHVTLMKSSVTRGNLSPVRTKTMTMTRRCSRMLIQTRPKAW